MTHVPGCQLWKCRETLTQWQLRARREMTNTLDRPWALFLLVMLPLFYNLTLVSNINFLNVYHLLLNIIMLILLHLSALNYILSLCYYRMKHSESLLFFSPSPSSMCWLCHFLIIRAQYIYIPLCCSHPSTYCSLSFSTVWRLEIFNRHPQSSLCWLKFILY